MPPTIRDLKLVSESGAFASLRPQSLARLTECATIVALRERELLFRQDDPTTALYIVVEGMLKLYRLTYSGEEAVIQILTQGDSVAAASTFAGKRYLVTAEAITSSRIIRIPTEHVMRCIQEMPDVALAIIAVTSQHLGHLVQHVEGLKAQSGRQRVAEFLLSLCRVDDGPAVVTLPYDKVLIAGRLGIKPESLSRAFAKLRSAGVEVRGASVAIQDVAVLREVAGEGRTRHPPPFRSAERLSGSMGSSHARELLLRRMAAIDLDFEAIARARPQTFRELQQVCTACNCRGRCSADLAGASGGTGWKAYCPNAAVLNALHAQDARH
jgi:CRP-like cAMP-binding protein